MSHSFIAFNYLISFKMKDCFSSLIVAMSGKMKEVASRLWNNVNRKKTITEDFHDTPLKKCLNTFDMTLLGIGQMIGAGIYVLTGKNRRFQTTPKMSLTSHMIVYN